MFDEFGFDLGDAVSDTDWSWLDGLANVGAGVDDLASMVLDTETGQLVDIASLAPEDLADLDLSGSGSGPVMEDPFEGSLDTSSTSGSTSDHLRSLEGGDGTTPGSEPFHGLSTEYSYPDSFNWAKALSGLGSALSGVPSGLSRLGADSGGGGVGIPPLAGTMGAPSVGQMASSAPIGGLSALGAGASPDAGALARALGLDAQPGVSAALSHLQADPGTRLGLQAPIDPGKEPMKFTPLTIPLGGGAGPIQAMAGAPRLSGLQRLAAERR